jgi:uncharacterized protein YbbC (DUF1343 family)
MKKIFTVLFTFLIIANVQAIRIRLNPQPAATEIKAYKPQLENKNIALVVNQTSTVKGQHLVDILLENGIKIKKIFAPEHGFRGTGDAGEKLKNEIDDATQLPLISLYGDRKKPSAKDLEGIDIVVFDIQDVGARFYTYISTLQYVMEACAENKKKLIVLDRPNPNGNIVDGPVLEIKNKSFVGMQAIPIVHGMTMGEYAQMLNGEKLLSNKVQCNLTVLKCSNYSHDNEYSLPVPPSPNLKTTSAVLLYPSLCLFEGTEVSVGRGTATPFQVWGHPSYADNGFSFTPQSNVGSKKPPFENEKCYGADLNLPPYKIRELVNRQLQLQWLIGAYKLSPNKATFFNPFFTKLAGNTLLQQQIITGKSEKEIRASWKAGLDKFKKIRKKYLLYPDSFFE